MTSTSKRLSKRAASLALAWSLLLPCAAGESVSFVWKERPPVPLQPGDLVCRRGFGFWTHHFIDMSTRERRFSHVGIVVSNGVDTATIVHSEADDFGRGGVHCQDWRGFFDEATECAVFRYEGGAEQSAAIAERGMTMLGVPFDPAFDLADTNRLYCTEFVRLAVNGALGIELIGYTRGEKRTAVALDDVYRTGFTRIFDSKGLPEAPAE